MSRCACTRFCRANRKSFLGGFILRLESKQWVGIVLIVLGVLVWINLINLGPAGSQRLPAMQLSDTTTTNSYTYITTVTENSTGGPASGVGCWITSNPPGPVYTEVACATQEPGTNVTVSGTLGGSVLAASNGVAYAEFNLTTSNNFTYYLDFAGQGGSAPAPPISDIGRQIQVTGFKPVIECPANTACLPLILVQSWFIISSTTTCATNLQHNTCAVATFNLHTQTPSAVTLNWYQLISLQQIIAIILVIVGIVLLLV